MINYPQVDFKKIDQQLNKILSQFLNETKKIDNRLLPLAVGFVKACQGGKRIRGMLVKLGYELAGGSGQDINQVAAAVEILHTALLIHDDVIDQSLLRRGQPTLYQAFGGDHYGLSQAISLGDIGLYLAIKIIAEANFSSERKIITLQYLSRVIIQTGWGQILDVELPHLGKKVLKKDVKLLESLKTASYSVSGPLILGAILAGAEERLLGYLGKFGENLGIAFQIQDDILGVFGQEEQIGKSNTSDIEEGKNTLLIADALEKANSQQKDILGKFYGKGNQGSQGLEIVRQVFTDTGAVDFAHSQALQYASLAKKIIPKITQDKVMRKLLEEMTDYLVERSK